MSPPEKSVAGSSKKLPMSMAILAACVLGVGLGLFGFNIWHTSRCSSVGAQHEDIEENVKGLNRRLLEAESQVLRNELLMNKILIAM
jgi:hypothetical protein